MTIKTLPTGKVKEGLKGAIFGLSGVKEIGVDGKRVQIPLFDVEIDLHLWHGLELGRDFEIIGD